MNLFRFISQACFSRPAFAAYFVAIFATMHTAGAGEIVKAAFGKKPSVPTASELILTYGVVLDVDEFPDGFDALREALDVVHRLAPPGVRLEFTTDELPSFMIELVHEGIPEGYPAPHRFQVGYFETLSKDVDSATFIPAMISRHGPQAVHVYWDRVRNEPAPRGPFKHRRVARFDAFTRLVAALSREIYGSVLTLHTRPEVLPLDEFKHVNTDDFVELDRAIFKKVAYEAGVEALQRFEKLAKRAKQGPAAYDDIALAIGREKRNLVGAQRALDAVLAKREARAQVPQRSIRSLTDARCERLFK